MTKNMKRIHKVTVKRMVDESPDTSWLGEYSNCAETDYAIDRKHSLDCPTQTYNKPVYALDLLERVMVHLRNVKDAHCSTVKNRTDAEKAHDLDIWTDYDDAEDICIDAGTELEECDCGERGDMTHNEYRYFNGCIENYKGESPEDIRNYVRQDYERMERLNAGDWYFIGIRAEAEVVLTGSVVQTISSGGLWGTESDSRREHIESIEQEELADLSEQLHAVGFSKRAIAAASKNLEKENN